MSPRTRHTSGPAEEAIAEFVATTDWSAAQIHEELVRRFRRGVLKGVAVPSSRTVQRRVQELRGRDASTWSFWDDPQRLPTAAIPLLLDIAGQVLVRSGGSRRGITSSEASMVWRLAPATQGLAPFDQYRLSQRASAAMGRPAALRVIEEYLMFRPWDSPDAAARYGRAFQAGLIKELVTLGSESVSVFQEAIGTPAIAPSGSFALASDREFDPLWGATAAESPQPSSPKSSTRRKA